MKDLIWYVAVMILLLTEKTNNWCLNNLKNCITCYANSCDQCKPGYFVVSNQISNQCKPCSPNCANCEIGTNGRTCNRCVQNAQMDDHNRCFFCDSKCASCSMSPTNCTSCPQGYQLLNTFIQTTCIKASQCQIKNCLNCTTQNSNITFCNNCQNGFYAFRKGCDRCSLPCAQCSFDIEQIWNNQVLNFWTTMKQNLITKIQSSRRLLEVQRPIDPIYNNTEENDYGFDNFTQSYVSWNMSTWNSTSWTSEYLGSYSSMSQSRVRGWIQAYLLFKTIQPYYTSTPDFTILIYKCLPLMDQLLNMTDARSGQWNHIARYISNVTNMSWSGRNLQNKLLEKAASKTKCITCQQGYYYISQNNTCQACSPNCGVCSSQTICTKCSKGYYTSNNACIKCNQSCLDCSQTADNCTECRPSEYLSSGRCLTCKQQCKGCNQDGYCIQCKYPYSIFASISSGCYKCKQQSCELCLQSNTSKCLGCRDGFMAVNGLCVECSAKNCLSCHSINSIQICLKCRQGYLVLNNSCLKCGPGCIQCSQMNFTRCTKCSLGKYLQLASSTCQLCPKYCLTCNQSNFCIQYLPGFTKYKDRVVQCQKGCNSCSSTNPSVCLKCKDSYYLELGSCKRCGKFCKTCTNSSACQTCADSTPSCSSCLGNCLTCSSSNLSECTTCKQGYKLVNSSCSRCMEGCQKCENSGGNEICTKCRPNFALKADGVCSKCLQNCYGICDSSDITKCLMCPIGFQYIDRNCKLCPNGCMKCQNSQCLTCQPDYRIIQTFTGDFVCTRKCKSPCVVCIEEKCLQCAVGYVINNATNSCIVDLSCNPRCQYCLAGSYMNTVSNNCVLCPTNCFTCSNSGCLSCQSGYYLQSNGNCISCVAPCKACFASDKCQKCIQGYVLQILTQNQIQGYVFGDQCLKCDGNCKTCSLIPNRCLTCNTGMILRGVKCVGKYGIKFTFQLNKVFNDFLQNTGIATFLQELSTLISVSKHNISITQVKQGSTRIQGHISAQSQSAANIQKTTLQNTVALRSYPIISSQFDIVVNNNQRYDSKKQDDKKKKQNDEKWKQVGTIIGASIGSFGFILIIIFVCYCCIKKKTKTSNQQNVEIVQQSKNHQNYQVMTGFHSDNIAIDNQSQYKISK